MEKQELIKREIRLDIIFSIIRRQWRKYIVPLVITFVVGAAALLCIPRYYTVTVKLAPEYNSSTPSLGSLGSLASMAGVNLSSMGSHDAIVPLYYPDVIASTQFAVPLFFVPVEKKDGSFKGTYSEYLQNACRTTPWSWFFYQVKELIAPTVQEAGDKAHKVDPNALTKQQDELYRAVTGNINCSVDKKTDVITIAVTAQDPLVATQLANAVQQHLQEFIIQYRTQKARNDFQHYTELLEKNKEAYKKAQDAYTSFADANQGLTLPSFRKKEENLENELQTAYTLCTTTKAQLAMAEAKLTERTPAFTTLQNATVPVKHTGPKRMMMLVVLLLFTFLLRTLQLVLKAQ